jgi:hypothetical protein
MSGVKKVGIDETSTRKGRNYISVFVDMMEALTKKDLDWLASVTRKQLADARYRIFIALADCSKDIVLSSNT